MVAVKLCMSEKKEEDHQGICLVIKAVSNYKSKHSECGLQERVSIFVFVMIAVVYKRHLLRRRRGSRDGHYRQVVKMTHIETNDLASSSKGRFLLGDSLSLSLFSCVS